MSVQYLCGRASAGVCFGSAALAPTVRAWRRAAGHCCGLWVVASLWGCRAVGLRGCGAANLWVCGNVSLWGCGSVLWVTDVRCRFPLLLRTARLCATAASARLCATGSPRTARTGSCVTHAFLRTTADRMTVRYAATATALTTALMTNKSGRRSLDRTRACHCARGIGAGMSLGECGLARVHGGVPPCLRCSHAGRAMYVCVNTSPNETKPNRAKLAEHRKSRHLIGCRRASTCPPCLRGATMQAVCDTSLQL